MSRRFYRKCTAVLPHADAQHLDEIRFPLHNFEDAALEQGLHPLARGGFPDGGHRFKEEEQYTKWFVKIVIIEQRFKIILLYSWRPL